MTTANENFPGKTEGVITSPTATCSAAAWSIKRYWRLNCIPHSAWAIMQGDERIIEDLTKENARQILAAHESCLPPNWRVEKHPKKETTLLILLDFFQ